MNSGGAPQDEAAFLMTSKNSRKLFIWLTKALTGAPLAAPQ
jgi:hypothetical protein